jgi:hypothetical protein
MLSILSIFSVIFQDFSSIFILSMSVEIKATCHNCQILSELKFCENQIILSILSFWSCILIFIAVAVASTMQYIREARTKFQKDHLASIFLCT